MYTNIKKKILVFTFFSLLFSQSCFANTNLENPKLNDNHQLILVIGKNWNSKEAKFWCFEKDNSDKWNKVYGPYRAMIGRKGFAWANKKYKEIIKKEGDSKSPAGIFPIVKAFGFPNYQKNLKIPYIYITNDTFCIDDNNSKFYNQIINSNTVNKDWNSVEEMRKYKQYKLGLIIGYNNDYIKKPIGSCIFMHIWKNRRTATHGCTAFSEKRIKYLIRWLDIKKNPVLVQLPKSEYKKLRLTWNLPLVNI